MLARDLHRSRAELGATLSAREVAWWRALYEVEQAERKHADEQARARRGRGMR